MSLRVILKGATDEDDKTAENPAVREAFLAFLAKPNPFSRHKLLGAICALGHRSDQADRMIDRIRKVSARLNNRPR